MPPPPQQPKPPSPPLHPPGEMKRREAALVEAARAYVALHAHIDGCSHLGSITLTMLMSGIRLRLRVYPGWRPIVPDEPGTPPT